MLSVHTSVKRSVHHFGSVGTFASDQVLAFVHYAMPFDIVAGFDGATKGSTPRQ